MSRKMLINASEPEEIRVSVVEGSILEEFYVERQSVNTCLGNIYKGRVTNIEPSIGAAFIEFGGPRHGFLHVSDVMHSGDKLPKVGLGATLKEAILEMSQKGLGMTAIVDGDNRVAGLFTDGDLRRTLEKHEDIRGLKVAEVMTRNPRSIGPGRLAAEAAQMMQAHHVSGRLLVVDDDGRLVGAVHVDDLLKAGVI